MSNQVAPASASALPRPRSHVQIFSAQLEALLIKCFKVLARRPGTLSMVLLGPTVFAVLLYLTNSAIMSSSTSLPIVGVDLSARPCVPFLAGGTPDSEDMSCITLAFVPASSAVAREVVALLASAADLTVADSVGSPSLESLDDDIVGFDEAEDAARFVHNRPGRLDAAVIFDFDADADGFVYRLWVNASAEGYYAFPQEDPWHYVALQSALNRAIVKRARGAAEITARIEPFPDLSLMGTTDAERLSGTVSVIPFFGGVFMVMGISSVGVVVLQLVTGEKRNKLVGVMRMMGLSEAAFWLSHWISLLCVTFLGALVLVILAPALTDLRAFTEVDFGVSLLVHWTALHSTACLALSLASFTSGSSAVQVVSSVLFSLSVFFQMITALGLFGVSKWNTYYSPDSSIAARLIFYLWPWFHYGKCFDDFLAHVGVVGVNSAVDAANATRFTMNSASQLVGDTNFDDGRPSCLTGYSPVECSGCKVGVGTADVFPDSVPSTGWCCCKPPTSSDGLGFISPLEFGDGSIGAPFGWFAPSVMDTVGYMASLSIIYYCLAWYLGQVGLGSSDDGGAQRRPWFVFMPEYWGVNPNGGGGGDIVEGDTRGEVQRESHVRQTVKALKLSKSYASVTALREVSLTMKKDEVFCLLGQNGAGKTTTIKCLTGLVNPTAGSAFVFGMDVQTQLNQIQQLMGVCPQHDVLFDELTAAETLRFWGRFKGTPRGPGLEEKITSVLADINLSQHGDALASTFSGGMMRRLSVGISTMGNPQCVFLDEPSTGLDPLSRRRIWATINRLKVGRVVVLTTHSMEEADALSDQIAIMGEGRLRALGTSLFLKDRFGTGYSVALTCEEPDTDVVLAHVKSLLPGIEVLANAAGFLNIGIPKRLVRSIPAFFATLENRSGGGAKVKEWGISNTKLEDVFLRLVGGSNDVNRGIGNAVEQEVEHELNNAAMLPGGVGGGEVIVSPGGSTFTVIGANDGTAQDDQKATNEETLAATSALPPFRVAPGETIELEPVTLFSRADGSNISEVGELFRLVKHAKANAPDADAAPLHPAGPVQEEAPPVPVSTADSSLATVPPATLNVVVAVPPNVRPGDSFNVELHGNLVSVQVPTGTAPGQQLQLTIPNPAASASSEVVTTTEMVSAPSLAQQEPVQGLQAALPPLADPRTEDQNVGTILDQVKALYIKDITIQRKLWRGMCARTCCCGFVSLLLVAISALVGFGASYVAEARDSGQFGICDDGSNWLNEKVHGYQLNVYEQSQNDHETMLDAIGWDEIFQGSESEGKWTKRSNDDSINFNTWRINLCNADAFEKYLANKGSTKRDARRLGSALTRSVCTHADVGMTNVDSNADDAATNSLNHQAISHLFGLDGTREMQYSHSFRTVCQESARLDMKTRSDTITEPSGTPSQSEEGSNPTSPSDLQLCYAACHNTDADGGTEASRAILTCLDKEVKGDAGTDAADSIKSCLEEGQCSTLYAACTADIPCASSISNALSAVANAVNANEDPSGPLQTILLQAGRAFESLMTCAIGDGGCIGGGSERRMLLNSSLPPQNATESPGYCSHSRAVEIPDFCLLRSLYTREESIGVSGRNVFPIEKARIWLQKAPNLATDLSAREIFGHAPSAASPNVVSEIHVEECGVPGTHFGLRNTDDLWDIRMPGEDESSRMDDALSWLDWKCSGVEVRTVTDLSGLVLESQRALEANAENLDAWSASGSGRCWTDGVDIATPETDGTYGGNYSSATARLRSTFPDAGVHLAAADIQTGGAITLQVTLHLWASSMEYERAYSRAYVYSDALLWMTENSRRQDRDSELGDEDASDPRDSFVHNADSLTVSHGFPLTWLCIPFVP